MKVAVLGAGGIVAPAIVRDLAESAEVGEMLLMDLDEDRARAAAEAHGAGKAHAAGLDARGDALGKALRGVDVLVNAASYRMNLHAMRACLAGGCHYVDLGGLYWLTEKQLALHEAFEGAGLLAILGMGASPGKTNVMAVRAVAELGARPERVDVLAAGRELEPPAVASYPYSPRTLVDELTLAPVVVREGRPVELEPLSDGGEVEFPAPIGRASTIYTLHSEIRTFPESFGCTSASFRLSLPPALLERVRALAQSPERIETAARAGAPPSPQTVAVHLVRAARGDTTVELAAITEPMADWGLGGGVVSTAAPAAAAVRMLARDQLAARGALPPERCIEPGTLFRELERRGTTFHLSTRGAPAEEVGATG